LGFAAGAVFALLSSAGGASAAWYEWTLSGGGDTGSGTLETGAVAGGGNDILSFTGSIDGETVGLFGGQPGPTGADTPGDWVYFNNILYPNSVSGDDLGVALRQRSIADCLQVNPAFFRHPLERAGRGQRPRLQRPIRRKRNLL
jgi:hypothetical protein